MSSLPVPSGRPKGQIRSRCHGGGAATAPSFIAFPGNVCPKGNVAIVHEKGRLIPAIIARELPSPLVPPLPVDKLAINRRRSPCTRKVRTVSLAVAPGKRGESSRLPEPLHCEM